MQAHYPRIACISVQVIHCTTPEDALKLLSAQTSQAYIAALPSISQPPAGDQKLSTPLAIGHDNLNSLEIFSLVHTMNKIVCPHQCDIKSITLMN